MSFHQTIVEGFIARDSEMRYLPTGVAVANTSIAVTEKWKTESGEQKEKTTWYRLNVWGKSAEAFHNWAKKGTGMLITGKMETPKPYMDKEGKPACQLEIKVDSWTFSSAKKADGNSAQSSGPQYVPDGQEFSLISPEEAEKVQW